MGMVAPSAEGMGLEGSSLAGSPLPKVKGLLPRFVERQAVLQILLDRARIFQVNAGDGCRPPGSPPASPGDLQGVGEA